MPIYAYKCASCGHAKDVLQKMSDAQLTQCPACGAPTFTKQVTAAGFQLKGSGWYVTDFKGGGTSAPAADKAADRPDKAADRPDKAADKADKAADKAADSGASSGGKPAETASKPSETKTAVAASPPAEGGSSGTK